MSLPLKRACARLLLATLAVTPVAFASSVETCAPPPSPVSLSQAVQRALCANPSLRGYQFELAAAQANSDRARAAYLPSVTAGYSKQRLDAGGETSQRQVALNWLLYDFGGRSATYDAAKASAAAASSVLADQAQSLALDVAQGYFQLQANEAAVDAALAQEAASKHALELATARHKAGEAIRLDVLQAQSALSQATVARTRAVAAVATSRAYLAMLLDVPAESSAGLKLAGFADEVGKAPPQALADLVLQAKSARADLRAGQEQLRALRSQAEAARAAHLPTVSLVGNLGRTTAAAGPSVSSNSIGINVSIPLFAGGATQAQARALTAQADAQEQRLHSATNRAGYDVVSTYQTLLAASDQLAAASTLAESARAALDQAVARYRAGVGAMLEVFDSLSKRASAEETLISSRLNLQLARVQLARSLGQMPVQ
ncbi:Antibiotic efflux pump outer membrane protein ArpC precursor [compost metagenome]